MKIGGRVKIGKIDEDWEDYSDSLKDYVGEIGIIIEVGKDWFLIDKGANWAFPISCAIPLKPLQIGDRVKIIDYPKTSNIKADNLLKPSYVGVWGTILNVDENSVLLRTSLGEFCIYPTNVALAWDKEDFENTKVEITPKQSEKLQKYLFSLGFEWWINEKRKEVQHVWHPFLYVDESVITWSSHSDRDYFNKQPHKLIHFEDIVFDEKFEKEYLFEQALKDKTNEIPTHLKEYPLTLDEAFTVKEGFDELANITKGLKESSNKLMTFELDAKFTLKKIEVMTKNKSKYPRGNQYKDIPWIELFEAMERHLLECKKRLQNNNFDLMDEDGCSHLVKISTNAEMLDIQLRKK